MAKTYYDTVTIASGESQSNGLPLGGRELCGLTIPATITGGSVTFLNSDDLDGTYSTVYDPENEADYSVNIAAGKYIPVDITKLAGASNIKVASDTTEGGARTIGISTKDLT